MKKTIVYYRKGGEIPVIDPEKEIDVPLDDNYYMIVRMLDDILVQLKKSNRRL